MISEVITLCGNQYLVKYPLGALITAERKLGWNITELKNKLTDSDMSFADMVNLVLCGLHTLDGVPISDEEYQKLLNNVDMMEFNEVVPAALSAIGGKPTQGTPSKN